MAFHLVLRSVDHILLSNNIPNLFENYFLEI